MQFLDSFNSVTFYSLNLKQVLKALAEQAPKDTNFQNIVRIGYDCLTATTSVFSGLNPLTGATGQQEHTPADFRFPVAFLNHLLLRGKSSASGTKRKRVEESETDPQQLAQQSTKGRRRRRNRRILSSSQVQTMMILPKSPIKHNVQLKKLPHNVFVGNRI